MLEVRSDRGERGEGMGIGGPYISVRSSGVTPGSHASSMMRPSRNSMM